MCRYFALFFHTFLGTVQCNIKYLVFSLLDMLYYTVRMPMSYRLCRVVVYCILVCMPEHFAMSVPIFVFYVYYVCCFPFIASQVFIGNPHSPHSLRRGQDFVECCSSAPVCMGMLCRFVKSGCVSVTERERERDPCGGVQQDRVRWFVRMHLSGSGSPTHPAKGGGGGGKNNNQSCTYNPPHTHTHTHTPH